MSPPPTPAQFRLGVQEYMNRAVAVFLGEVVSRDRVAAVLKVEKVWKGKIDETARVEIAFGSPDGRIVYDTCVYDFQDSKKHLVFAEEMPGGGVMAGKCRLTAPMPQAAKTVEVLDDLVKSWRPK